MFSSALWDLANSRPVHSMMLFSHLLLYLQQSNVWLFTGPVSLDDIGSATSTTTAPWSSLPPAIPIVWSSVAQVPLEERGVKLNSVEGVKGVDYLQLSAEPIVVLK